MSRLLAELFAEFDAARVAKPASPATTCATDTQTVADVAGIAAGSALRARMLALAADELLPARLIHGLADADVLACATFRDATLRAYLQALARREEMDRGLAPSGYIHTVHCDGCGPVLLWPDCPPTLKACPWCFRRKAGKSVPRPCVRCGDCRHHRPDPLNPAAGVGECAAGAEPRWPMQAHPCELMRPLAP